LLAGSTALRSRRPVHRLLRGAYEFCDEPACLTTDNIRNEVKSLPLFIDHRRCEKAVHLHVDIPRTSGRVSDLPFEAVL
jgi:hypothetical protein